MAAIFRTEFRDLQDNEGNTTKASTAKFVCIALADHANDEGEGAYPSIAKISYKTSLSRTAVINALDALKHNGILIANGTSKYDTVNYTVNPFCFSQGSQPSVLVNPVDPPSQLGVPPPVNPVDPNHTLTIQEPSTEITSTAKQEPDKVAEWLKMGQFAGAKRETRIDAILSYLGERFHVNTEVKKWKDFAKFVETRQTHHGENVDVFVSWLLSQKDFNLQYWPPSKMEEFWPMAFVKNEKVSQQYRSERLERSL